MCIWQREIIHTLNFAKLSTISTIKKIHFRNVKRVINKIFAQLVMWIAIENTNSAMSGRIPLENRRVHQAQWRGRDREVSCSLLFSSLSKATATSFCSLVMSDELTKNIEYLSVSRQRVSCASGQFRRERGPNINKTPEVHQGGDRQSVGGRSLRISNALASRSWPHGTASIRNLLQTKNSWSFRWEKHSSSVEFIWIWSVCVFVYWVRCCTNDVNTNDDI